MSQRAVPPSRGPRWGPLPYVVVALLATALAFVGCSVLNRPPVVTPGPTTPATGSAQQITLTSPAPGSTVQSPIRVVGTTTVSPFENNLNYRLFGPDEAILAQGFITTIGELGAPGAFSAEIPYTLAQQGNGRLEVLEFDQADGSIRAIASTQLVLSPGQAPPPTAQAAASPTPATQPTPGAQQQILIDSPPPGTEVGSPVVITGRTARAPAGSSLSYVIRDAAGGVLGSGSFPAAPAAAGGASFNASITFNLPPNGGPVNVELTEPGAAGQPPVASATLPLAVAPPQAILIDSPPPGTTVGSPVVITGRTARYPFQGNLGYRVLDGSGRQLGIGTFPVQGGPGGPASFNASINFSLPPNGGRISVEIGDQNAANGQIAAAGRIDLNVAPPQQAIVIESPPAGTLVGSPMTVTGRVVRLPGNGALTYRVRDARGAQIGQGSFGVVGSQDGGARFNAQVIFTPPQGGGPITLELLELDASGQVRTSATLGLQVAGAPPPATSTPAPPAAQAISIDTPPAGTVVGSPVVITGRTALPPRTGRLFYVVRSLSRDQLGQGEFPVPAGQPTNVPFVASIAFAEPPQGGGVVVEIYDRDAVGNQLASAVVQLQVNPRNPPTPTPPTGGQVGQQEITIETPPPGTVVGSPVVVTGRLALAPADGDLSFRVLDGQGNVIGQGSFSVPITVAGGRIPFVASITFAEPAQGGPVRVVITDADNGSGAVRAEAQVDLAVNPRPYPQPRTP